MNRIEEEKKQANWFKTALQEIKEDFKLRKMLMPARKSELSSKVKK